MEEVKQTRKGVRYVAWGARFTGGSHFGCESMLYLTLFISTMQDSCIWIFHFPSQ